MNDSCAKVFCSRAGERKGPVQNGDLTLCMRTRWLATAPVPSHFVPTQPEQLAAVAKDFKVYYKKAEGATPTSYTMDHSAATYVYDTKGQLRLYAKYGAGPQVLVDDIRKLLAA